VLKSTLCSCSSSTTALFPSLATMRNALHLLSSFTSASALCFSSNYSLVLSPLLAAWCSAVRPSSSVASTTALLFSSSHTTTSCCQLPPNAALPLYKYPHSLRQNPFYVPVEAAPPPCAHPSSLGQRCSTFFIFCVDVDLRKAQRETIQPKNSKRDRKIQL
jgi:hypothetical protein